MGSSAGCGIAVCGAWVCVYVCRGGAAKGLEACSRVGVSGETGGREGDEEGREVEGVKEVDIADCSGGWEEVVAGVLLGRGGEVSTFRPGVILGCLLVGAFGALRRGRDLEGIGGVHSRFRVLTQLGGFLCCV